MKGGKRLFSEGVPYPFEPAFLHADYIEAAGGLVAPQVALHELGQEVAGSPQQAALLAAVYTGGSSPMAGGGAMPDFDEDQHLAVERDQVDLATAAKQIALQHAQAMALEPKGGACFREVAGVLRGGQSHGAECQQSRKHSMNESIPVTEAPMAWKRLAERVAAQHWPASALYVVATPIGNLGDLGLRAWQALQRCDVIAAEDTRSSRILLDAWGIGTPLMAAHRHNEAAAAEAIVQRLQAGERVALISDAGAPAVSDPGARIVRAVREAGLAVVPVPGASAVIAALMASGATSDENPAFVFAGFAPPKQGARRKWLQRWCAVPAPVVLFESPHRVQATVEDMLEVCGPARRLTIARELTKRFEQVDTLPLSDAPRWLAEDAHRRQGEFVLIVHEAEADTAAEASGLNEEAVALLDALLETLSLRDAVKLAAKVSGAPRDALYALALSRTRTEGPAGL